MKAGNIFELLGLQHYFLMICLLLTTGCDLIEYHPYEGDIDSPRNLNAEQIARIQTQCEGKKTIRFAFMGDSQRWYDETQDFVRHINRIPGIDFVIHGGDIADFGMKKEFLWIHEIMSQLYMPYIAIIGNHDIIGCGDLIYEQMYGPQNFSFTVNGIKFVCLSTNALEYDYSRPIPDFEFMKRELQDSLHNEKTIIAMHSPPFSDQFNNNANEQFAYYVRNFRGIQFCLHAHNHSASIRDLFDDGIIYYGCDSMKKRSYFLFTITENGYEYEQIYF